MKLFYRRKMKMAVYYFFHPVQHIKSAYRMFRRLRRK